MHRPPQPATSSCAASSPSESHTRSSAGEAGAQFASSTANSSTSTSHGILSTASLATVSSTSSPKENELLPGMMLANKYKVFGSIGRGAFGVIVEAIDVHSGIHVAIKTEPNNAKLNILKREGRILNKLETAAKMHCARFIEYLEDEEAGFSLLVMELLGDSFKAIKVDSQNQLAISGVLRFAVGAVSALEELHSIGYVHRDVKPSNFCRGVRDVHQPQDVFLIDFGLCCLASPKTPTGAGVSKTKKSNGFVGTKKYASAGAHCNVRQNFVDDYWSLFYTLLDLCGTKLPWARAESLDEAGALKKDQDIAELTKGLPVCFHQIAKHLSCADGPGDLDIEYILDILQDEIDDINDSDAGPTWFLENHNGEDREWNRHPVSPRGVCPKARGRTNYFSRLVPSTREPL